MEDEGTVELRDSRRFDTNTNSGQISPQKLWKRASLFFLTGGAAFFFLPLSLSIDFSWLLIINSRSREANYVSTSAF